MAMPHGDFILLLKVNALNHSEKYKTTTKTKEECLSERLYV